MMEPATSRDPRHRHASARNAIDHPRVRQPPRRGRTHDDSVLDPPRHRAARRTGPVERSRRGAGVRANVALSRARAAPERDGLVAVRSGQGKAKYVELTAKGRKRIASALPHWNAAQEEFVSRFGRAAWLTLSSQLVEIVDIARALPDEQA